MSRQVTVRVIYGFRVPDDFQEETGSELSEFLDENNLKVEEFVLGSDGASQTWVGVTLVELDDAEFACAKKVGVLQDILTKKHKGRDAVVKASILFNKQPEFHITCESF